MCRGRFHRQADAGRIRQMADRRARTTGPCPSAERVSAGPRRQAAFAFVAYMSTYSCPDSRITSAITESVTARST